MSSKAEKERLKQIQDKCQNLLMQMLKDDDNKYCVDCDAKGPRWASWNIGIFLCIRCAGIHRNLGVHISRVKSVNLDTWTPEQVVSLQQMGNSRARAVYEANIPDNFRRPQTDSTLEAFIRAKYEQKKYIASEWVPPALPKVNWDKEFDEEAEKARRKKKEASKSNGPAAPVRAPLSSVPVPAPLPKPMSSSPKTSRNKSAASAGAGASVRNLSADLLGLDISSPEPSSQVSSSANNSSSLDSDFNSFLSASLISPPHSLSNNPDAGSNPTGSSETNRTAEEDNFFNQPASSGQTKKQLTTDSILALYGKSTPSLPSQVPQAMFTSQGMEPNIATSPAQTAFGSPFVNRSPVPPQAMSFPTENTMFPSNQYVANPFYSMVAQAPSSLPQTNRQQFQFTTPLDFQMGNLNLASTSVPIAPQHPMAIPGQPFRDQTKFFNQAPSQPSQPLNQLGQTLSNNLWQ